jgi:hypothetical protein
MFSDKGARIDETTHSLRGFGTMLIIIPNFVKLTAKVKFKV